MVFNETVSVPWAVMSGPEFTARGHRGGTPLREGTYWLAQILERMVEVAAPRRTSTPLLDVCDNILGRSFCAR